MKRAVVIRRSIWALVGCWAVTVYVLSSISGDKLQPVMLNVWGWDKILHATAFAAGGALVCWALRISTRFSWICVLVLAISAVSIYGASDEWHQTYTPHRTGRDLGDWLADTIGATVGAAGAYLIYAGYRGTKSAEADCEAALGD
jgi:VanZ family protein